jgi:zinc transport system substrate-binding protein
MNWRFGLLSMAMLAGLGLSACGGRGATADDNSLVVSIEPLRFIVSEIVGGDFEIETLVPPGASPETWEPTPQKMRAAENAELVFTTGLIGFETVILSRLPAPERFVNLSAAVETISQPAADNHAGDHSHNHTDSPTDNHNHIHPGVDPHIWMSPRALAQMSRTAYDAIHALWPDSTSYTANYTRLSERLKALDREVSIRLASAPTRSFAIFHPGLTYYARDYGLRQIALESNGKEPSVRQLADLIEQTHRERIAIVLYQREFPRRTVEVLAAEIGAVPVEVDILGPDVEDNILNVTDIIAGKR